MHVMVLRPFDVDGSPVEVGSVIDFPGLHRSFIKKGMVRPLTENEMVARILEQEREANAAKDDPEPD